MLIKRAGARRNHVSGPVGFSFPYGGFPGRRAQTSPQQRGQLAVQGPPAQERPRTIQEVPFSGPVGKISASPAAPECDQPAAAPGGLRMAAGPGGAADDDGCSGAEGHRPELFPAVLGPKRVPVVESTPITHDAYQRYRRVLGKLSWLALTRADLQFAVGFLAIRVRATQTPAVKRAFARCFAGP